MVNQQTLTGGLAGLYLPTGLLHPISNSEVICEVQGNFYAAMTDNEGRFEVLSICEGGKTLNANGNADADTKAVGPCTTGTCYLHHSTTPSGFCPQKDISFCLKNVLVVLATEFAFGDNDKDTTIRMLGNQHLAPDTFTVPGGNTSAYEIECKWNDAVETLYQHPIPDRVVRCEA